MSADFYEAEGARPTVAVYGAAGHTGRFVLQELSRRGFPIIAIGRNAVRLTALSLPDGTRRVVATFDDAAAVGRALHGAAALINCAGPFLDSAAPLVSAALRAGIPYLDITAEQASAQAVFERFGLAAEQAGVVIIPAMGFWGGLGDLLATAAMGDWVQADTIRLNIALDSWNPTEGTRITGQRNTARRLIVSDGRLQPLADPAPQHTWSFAAPFGRQEMAEVPLSETILLSRHLQVGEIHNYVNTASLRELADPTTPPPTAADEWGRSAQIFLVDVEVRQGDKVRRKAARGQDIYAITAPLVVEAVQRILTSPDQRNGAFAPGDLFDAPSFLAALAPQLELW
ncbi:saccharopine dehydrogenase family protein [Devosia psychrophila]|uniref:Saccharopine dehydrogenase n=1 Tax=Devosia psychrophila TaxID=728005 RepID=A0A0F5PSN5_9HYPH|nr:saccharopine dehydrogenase NADP-binding domain-containing protein [Devosia psychrophila]KKC31595.1 saccharopine dehydrogenase [Devosia psychrophila]SFD45102.1 Uncharacterized conserved protein [Devosia psychrophila]